MRTRSFDEREVLESAMHAFRRSGYGGISIKDLEAATNLSSGSLYNAFGDKDGVFRAAICHYVTDFVRKRLIEHAGADAGLEELEQLFLSLLREPMTDGHGCLLTNSIVEFGAKPSAASDQISLGIEMLTESFASVLEREIGTADAKREATLLLLIYQGMLVLSRSGLSHAGVEDAIRSQFERLRHVRVRFKNSTQQS